MKRIIGMAVGVVYFGIAFGAYARASAGWRAGHADLGVWWSVVAAFLAIAGLVALVGTWLHTRPTPR